MPRQSRWLLAALLSSLLLASHAAASEKSGDAAAVSSDTPAGAKPEEGGEYAPWASGQIDLGYVFRAALHSTRTHSREYDQDLTQDLFAEGGLGRRVRFEASLRVHEDIDGRPRVSQFRDVWDTYSLWARAVLYTGYVEGLDLGPVARVRGGRQQYTEGGLNVRFDGVLAETVALGDLVKLVAFAGLPTRLYYSSSLYGDWVVGGGLEVVAIPMTSLRLDCAHVTDYRPDLQRLGHALGGVPFDVNRDDDLFVGSIVVRPFEALRLEGRVSTLEGRSTRAEGAAFFDDKDLGLSIRARYVAQLGSYRTLSAQWAPFDFQLGPYEPYQEVLIDARQALGDHFAIGGGGAVRQLFKRHDEGKFNHEFWRVYGQLDVADLPWEGLHVSGMVEFYRSLTFGRTFQASGSVSQEIGPVEIAGGSSYAAFKLDPSFLVERSEVRTFFGSLQVRPVKWLRFKAEYDYEQGNEERYHVVRCNVRLDF